MCINSRQQHASGLSLSLLIPNIMPCLFQGLPNIVIPGGEILKWFIHMCLGDNVQLSFPGCDELIGIVLCEIYQCTQWVTSIS